MSNNIFDRMNRKQKRKFNKDMHKRKCTFCKERLKESKEIWIITDRTFAIPFCSKECREKFKAKVEQEQSKVVASPTEVKT